ncbi:MAG: hypothetical protein HQ526_05625 [Actinobacteria bacterium]|nr:hypothetical protein [Actinomycetota bacterium]
MSVPGGMRPANASGVQLVPPPVDVGLADADVDVGVDGVVGLAEAAVSDELEQPAITSVAAPAIASIVVVLPSVREVLM